MGVTINALKLLAKLVNEQLIVQYIWSDSRHNIADLLEQLLIHNFLEISDQEISFWHASFRDFFAAIYIANMESPLEKAIENAERQEWSLVTAFLDGLLTDSRPIRDVLISIHNNVEEYGYWPIETLRLMGSDAIRDILRAISQYNFHDGMMLVGEGLLNLDFDGSEFFTDAVDILSNLKYVPEAYFGIDINGTSQYPPNIDWDYFEDRYTKILNALIVGDLEKAKKYRDDMYDYLDSFKASAEALDQWLLTRNIIEIDDFELRLNQGLFSTNQLREFCKNTIMWSSLPYLELIMWKTEDFTLRMEAKLAIESIERR